jgi:hypothetical protein
VQSTALPPLRPNQLKRLRAFYQATEAVSGAALSVVAVSIIHLDVERFEAYALRGARKTIVRCQPLLILETVPAHLEGYRMDRQLDHQTCLLTPIAGDVRSAMAS